MNVNIEELKRLAKEATPGPWDVAVWTCGVRGCEVKRGIDRIGCDLHFPNAEFIAAANPATILALIADFERITKQHGELQSALERMVDLTNNDGLWCNYDEVIHAEAVLEQIYKSRQKVEG